MTADLRTRHARAGEHLQLLQALSAELERAMQAMVRNDLADLEDSIASQQELSRRLSALAGELRAATPSLAAHSADEGLQGQIRCAAAELNKLNLRYSILLEHSSRSVAMMASLFHSFRGQIQEGAGAGSQHQTWSCRV